MPGANPLCSHLSLSPAPRGLRHADELYTVLPIAERDVAVREPLRPLMDQYFARAQCDGAAASLCRQAYEFIKSTHP